MMADFLKSVDGRWLLIGSICAFGAALILFIISGVIICKICCKKKKKELDEEGHKEELNQFLDPEQSEAEDELLNLPDDDATLKGTFEQVNHVEEQESRRSSTNSIGRLATPLQELKEEPEAVILDVVDDVPIEMAAPPTPSTPPRISPPPPAATPPRISPPPSSTPPPAATPSESMPPPEAEIPVITVDTGVIEEAAVEPEAVTMEEEVPVTVDASEIHSDTLEELPVEDGAASSFVMLSPTSALPPLDDSQSHTNSLGYSMGSTMSLQSGFSSSCDGLDDGSPVKGKRKRRHLLKKTTFSKEFSIYASVKVSLQYIESVKCLKGAINSITGLNFTAAFIPDDLSFHLRFVPSRKFHIMTKYRSVTKCQSLDLAFTMGPVRKEELAQNQLRVKLYGRKTKRLSQSSCFGECSFPLIDIEDKSDPMEFEMDIQQVKSSRSNYSSDSDNLN